jgi:hypothetical protein
MLRGNWSIGVLEYWRVGGLGDWDLADWAALLYSVTPELLQLLTPVSILSQVEKIGAGLLTLETAFY